MDVELRRGGSALQFWPESPRSGEALQLAFLARMTTGDDTNQYDISLHDGGRRRVATIARREVVPLNGVITVTWDGRLDRLGPAPAGRYLLRVTRPASDIVLERTIYIDA